MQIVIDIPKVMYEGVKLHRVLDTTVDCIIDAVENGIPLPEGHGDLIDKEEFKKWIETQDGDRLMTEYYLDALEMQEKIVGGSDGDID